MGRRYTAARAGGKPKGMPPGGKDGLMILLGTDEFRGVEPGNIRPLKVAGLAAEVLRH